jgi:NADPH:quinone reductase-like Zn-dependent oxidoreductase
MHRPAQGNCGSSLRLGQTRVARFLPETMLAARDPTAGPDAGRIRLDRVPRPEPGPGELLVAVAVFGVNPTEWKARGAGGLAFNANSGRWVIANQDGAGVVVAAGDGVAHDAVLAGTVGKVPIDVSAAA